MEKSAKWKNLVKHYFNYDFPRTCHTGQLQKPPLRLPVGMCSRISQRGCQNVACELNYLQKISQCTTSQQNAKKAFTSFCKHEHVDKFPTDRQLGGSTQIKHFFTMWIVPNLLRQKTTTHTSKHTSIRKILRSSSRFTVN